MEQAGKNRLTVLLGSIAAIGVWCAIAVGAVYLVAPGQRSGPSGEDAQVAAGHALDLTEIADGELADLAEETVDPTGAGPAGPAEDAEAEESLADLLPGGPDPSGATAALSDGTAAAGDAEGPAASGDLPGALSAADLERYRKIFAAQAGARWKTADALIAELEDKRLLGDVLAQRYLHPTGYRSSYKELRRWLADYADLPDAAKIYKLAVKRRPKGGILPRSPAFKRSYLPAPRYAKNAYKSTKRLSKAERRKVRRLQARIRRQVGRSQLSVTEELIGSAEVQRLFDDVQIDEAYSRVAAGWFYFGDYEKAFRMAGEAAERSGRQVPLATWTAGLTAWRKGDFGTAARRFELYARAETASPWTASAGAYWAHRAYRSAGDQRRADYWLGAAARHPLTFYGLIAQQRLGRIQPLEFGRRGLDAKAAGVLAGTKRGARALAFLQMGEPRRAEKELMALDGWDRPVVVDAILAFAETAQLPALSLRISEQLVAAGSAGWSEDRVDAALYPIPPWKPKRGFAVDRALVYAFMRQESKFKHYAKSRDGARGLMQLMPATARSMARSRNFAGRGIYALYDPLYNIELGQRYLVKLLKHPRVEGNLFKLAVAYNGGPGNLGKWERRIHHHDPLLFVESIPTRETRMFIERVLTNLWIYRARLDQPSPSLEAIAAGEWPRYEALDGRDFAPGKSTAIAETPDKDADGGRGWLGLWRQ